MNKDLLFPLFNQARKDLLATIKSSSNVDLSQLSFPHPALGRINMYQWVLFTAKHERCHTRQVDSILVDSILEAL